MCEKIIGNYEQSWNRKLNYKPYTREIIYSHRTVGRHIFIREQEDKKWSVEQHLGNMSVSLIGTQGEELGTFDKFDKTFEIAKKWMLEHPNGFDEIEKKGVA